MFDKYTSSQVRRNGLCPFSGRVNPVRVRVGPNLGWKHRGPPSLPSHFNDGLEWNWAYIQHVSLNFTVLTRVNVASVIGRTKRRWKDAEEAVWKCWKAAGWPLPHWAESEEKPVFYVPPHGDQENTALKEKWNKVEEWILPMTFALTSGRLTSSPGLQ